MVFIVWKYAPNNAGFLRHWSLLNGVVEQGIDVDCYFLLPSKESINVNCSNLHCHCVGDKYSRLNKILILFCSLLFVLRRIKKNEIVFSTSFWLVLFCLSFKKIRLFLEWNEYPPLMFSKNILGSLLLRFHLRVLKKKATKVFVISEGIKEYFIDNGISEEKICVLNMTVDLKRFENVEKQKTGRYIAYCGTVSNYKDGVDVLLEAFAIVAKKHKDVKLYILGNTPYKEDKEKNERIIKENNIEERVFMPGMISGVLMPQYLKNAEILALARPDNIQAKYGFPTKLGEYLLTANPVVLTRVGEMDRFLVDGESCLFAEPDNVQDFADKLLWLLEHPKEGRVLGERGYVVAKQSFNYLIESKKIVEVIKSLSI